MQIQVTLFDKQNRYKPVSSLVNIPDLDFYKRYSKEIKKQGIVKICQKRYWTTKDLQRFGYTTCKVRVYDKNKIDKENKERYEKIKKERGWN